MPMQRPTLANIRIRSVEDARIILYAAHRGLLPVITRRLDADEKQALRPGDVYVWVEGNPQTDITGLGIVRWTDGRKWSQSRTRDEFLYYEEEDANGCPLPRPDRMVKQTYSTTVSATASRAAYRICLHTYYTDNSLRLYGTIDSIPELQGLQVPPGLFTRIKKPGRKSKDRLLFGTSHELDMPTVHLPEGGFGQDKPASSSSSFRPTPAGCASSPLAESKNYVAAHCDSDLPSHGSYDTEGHVSLGRAFSHLDLVISDKKPGAPSFSDTSANVHASSTPAPMPLDCREFAVRRNHYVLESTNPSVADRTSPHFISGVFGARAMYSLAPLGSTLTQEPRRMTSPPATSSGVWTTAGNPITAEGSLSLRPFSELRKDRAYRRDPIDDRHLKLLSSIPGSV